MSDIADEVLQGWLKQRAVAVPPPCVPTTLPSTDPEYYKNVPAPPPLAYLNPALLDHEAITNSLIPTPDMCPIIAHAEKNIINYLDAEMRDNAPEDSGCTICMSSLGPIEEINDKININHTHDSTIEFFKRSILSNEGMFSCPTCKQSPHLAVWPIRHEVIVSSSTIRGWRRYSNNGAQYLGDDTHVWEINIPGAKIKDLTHAIYVELRPFRKPFNIYFIGGLNDIDQCQDLNLESIISDVNKLIEVVNELNPSNNLRFITVPLPPKLTCLGQDLYSDIMSANGIVDKTQLVFDLNRRYQLHNEGDPFYGSTSADNPKLIGLHLRGLKTVRSDVSYGSYISVYGDNARFFASSYHSIKEWRVPPSDFEKPDWFVRVMHLSNAMIFKAGVGIYRAICKSIGIDPDNWSSSSLTFNLESNPAVNAVRHFYSMKNRGFPLATTFEDLVDRESPAVKEITGWNGDTFDDLEPVTAPRCSTPDILMECDNFLMELDHITKG